MFKRENIAKIKFSNRTTKIDSVAELKTAACSL